MCHANPVESNKMRAQAIEFLRFNVQFDCPFRPANAFVLPKRWLFVKKTSQKVVNMTVQEFPVRANS